MEITGDIIDPTINPPDLKPALLPSVHLGLTITYTTLYSLLFLAVYLQLWMIYYYKHRRFSYQTVFLFLCLMWSGLRTTLFAFYFKDAEEANVLPTFFYWLLYCFPVCLQFFTLCLMVNFFGQVSRRQFHNMDQRCSKCLVRLFTSLSVAIFLGTNIACAILIHNNQMSSKDAPLAIVYTRVIVNDLLFILYAILLSYNMYKVSKLPNYYQVLESQGTTKTQAIVVCALLVPLYVSRAVYNLIAVTNPTITTFGYSWINVSDQADINSAELGYLSFGIILFVWEFLPTFIVVVLFRVKRPRNNADALMNFGDRHSRYGAFFFDNPRHYDSGDVASTGDESNNDDLDPGQSSTWSSSVVYDPLLPPREMPNVSSGSTGPLLNPANPPAFYGDT